MSIPPRPSSSTTRGATFATSPAAGSCGSPPPTAASGWCGSRRRCARTSGSTRRTAGTACLRPPCPGTIAGVPARGERCCRPSPPPSTSRRTTAHWARRWRPYPPDEGVTMPRTRGPQPPVHLVSAGMVDVDKGEVVTPGDLLIEGDRIAAVAPSSIPDDAITVDLGEMTLLPGLMDMELNLLLGGPDHASPLNAVQDDPAVRTL